MPPSPVDASEQPTLRVMRLYKPRLETRRALPSCTGGDAWTAVAGGGARPSPGADSVTVGEHDFALKSALKLPDSFGNIYLGETFTAYIRSVASSSACVTSHNSVRHLRYGSVGGASLTTRRCIECHSLSNGILKPGSTRLSPVAASSPYAGCL